MGGMISCMNTFMIYDKFIYMHLPLKIVGKIANHSLSKIFMMLLFRQPRLASKVLDIPVDDDTTCWINV